MAFSTLPERYLGADEGFDVTYHVRLGDIGHTWEVRCTAHGARVRKGVSRRRPDVVIGTDADTWLRLRAGEMSGITAFSQRRLYARGDVDRTIAFEGMFRLPSGRPPLLRVHDVELPGRRISTLSMGEGPDVLCIHGLGAHEGVVLRPGRRADRRRLPRPRARPARLRVLLEADARGLRRALVRRDDPRT